MADTQPFKNYYGVELARELAARIRAVYSAFDADGFVDQVAAEVNTLELKARVSLMAQALRNHLPDDYAQAIDILLQTLPPPMMSDTDGMFNTGFGIMPLAQFVEDYGLDHFDLSMQAMYEITQRFTAEFAVRPYLIRYPNETLACLRAWVHDPNPHVRRWVSEGTRPRLPWGKRLDQFIRDPESVLELLEYLKDDESAYVRKSVANHLNDIAKDHPSRVVALLKRWKSEGGDGTKWIIRHALRTLVKQGHAEGLALLGYDSESIVTLVELSTSTPDTEVGGTLKLGLTLRNDQQQAVETVIDFRIHFLRANGKSSPKVFKWVARTLLPGETVYLKKNVSLRPITTRRYYPGKHVVDVQVNGNVLGETYFLLREPD